MMDQAPEEMDDRESDEEMSIDSDTQSTQSTSESEESESDDLAEKLALIGERPSGSSDPDGIVEELVSQAPVKFMKGEINYQQFVSLVSKKVPQAGDDGSQGSQDSDPEQIGIDEDVDMEFDFDDEFDVKPSTSMEARIRRDEQDHAALYEQELDKSRENKRLKQLPKSKLDPTLQGLVGEANLRFARGERRSVIDICLQVVTQYPYAPEPYQTLGMVYDEDGQRERSLQFLLIAAHLQRTDTEEWTRLGELAMEIGQVEQATSCYGKAYAMDRNNVQLGVMYVSLLGERMSKKTKLKFYKSLWARKDKRSQDTKALLQCSKEMARLCHELGDVDTAASVMTNAFISYMSDVIPEDLNFLLELMIAQRRYEAVVWILTSYYSTGLDVVPEEDVLEMTPEDVLINHAPIRFKELLSRSRTIIVPDMYPYDVRAKLVVSLVHLEIYWLADIVVRPFLKAGPDGVDDLFADIAEAYISKKKFSHAAAMLDVLANDPRYATSETLMSYGECQLECGEYVRAEWAYKQILAKWPNHVDARLSLSKVLRLLGETDEALDFITQDQTDTIDVQLLREKCMILLEEGRTEDLIPKAVMFFSRHFAELRSPDDVNCATLSARLQRLQGLVGTTRYTFSGAGVTPDDEWELFCSICSRLHRDNKFVELHRLCLSALGSTIFRRKGETLTTISYSAISRSSNLIFYAIQSCLLVGNYDVAFSLIRGMIIGNWSNHRVLQLLNIMFNLISPSVRHCRFLLRFLCKLQERGLPCDQALLINGNMCLSSGTYKLAVNDYISVFRRNLGDPLVSFLIGVCFIHLVCQKFTSFKHGFVVQAFTFLQTYRALRGECQEALYNIGRAYHQLGLTAMALQHYERALALTPVVSSDSPGRNACDLSSEIAYNMHLIYRSSGNHRLARGFLMKYCRV